MSRFFCSLRIGTAAVLLPFLLVTAGSAWGPDGHRMINRQAGAALPADVPERVAREQHAHEDARIAHAMPESEADRMARVRAETEEARRYRVRAEEEAENARRIRAQAYAQDQEAVRIRAEAAAEQADEAEAMAEAEAARAQELASVPVLQSGFTSPPSPTSAPRGIALDASNHPVDYEYAAQGYTKGVPNSFFGAGRPH